MGEAERRKLVDDLTRKLIDDGRLIEAGWMSFRILCIPDDAPEIQVVEIRNAFFAGAQHLFGSITSMLEADADPTEADLARMDKIASELDAFIAQFKLRQVDARGRA